MGTDVYIDGTLIIPSGKVLEAGKLLLQVIADKDELDPEHLPPEYAEQIKTPKGLLALLESRLIAFEVELGDDGSLSFAVEDCTRHEDSDEWLFENLAPVFDDGELYMSADDYKWMWEIVGGVFRVVNAETVYDHDYKAVPTIEKLVAIIYPEHADGKPLSAILDSADPEYESVVDKIENLLRETGYGPQAGMNGLERLSEV